MCLCVHSNETKPHLKHELGIKFTVLKRLKIPVVEIESGCKELMAMVL